VVVVFLPVYEQGEGARGRERSIGNGVSMATDDASGNVAKAVFFHIAHSSFSFGSVIFSIALHWVTLASEFM
jgi:hypothetical protein